MRRFFPLLTTALVAGAILSGASARAGSPHGCNKCGHGRDYSWLPFNFLSNVGIEPAGGGVTFSRAPGSFFNWPDGGYTLYPGEAGSGFAPGSDYSHINATVPAPVAANQVQQRLRELGIPPVPPPTTFLNVNPKAAEGVKLPFPARWLPKEKDDDEGGLPKGKEKPTDDKKKDTIKVKPKEDKDKDE